MRKLETLAFQTLIFLIPSNLAYHWILDSNYVSGILVDYLIPKLYLSDIPLICLFIIWLLKYIHKDGFKKINQIITKNRNLVVFFALFFALLTFKSITAERPISSLWFLLKIIEMIWLTAYLSSSFTQKSFFGLLQTPLTFSLITQSLIGFYQIIYQKSVLGYALLGEPILRSGANLSRGNINGSIALLPYGTTPHPNTLAGFCSFGILLLFLCIQKNPNLRPKNILSLIAIGLSLPLLLLTQSLSGIIGLCIGGMLIFLKINISKYNIVLITCLLFIINLILILLSVKHDWQLNTITDNASFSRRYELILLGNQVLRNHSWLGVGLNNSIPNMIEYGRVFAHTAFLQPIHNIYLLLLVETGIVGVLGALAIFIMVTRRFHPKSTTTVVLAPLLVIACIGFVDHYPLTLQTGQLFVSISLALPFLPSRK